MMVIDIIRVFDGSVNLFDSHRMCLLYALVL